MEFCCFACAYSKKKAIREMKLLFVSFYVACLNILNKLFQPHPCRADHKQKQNNNNIKIALNAHNKPIKA